MYNKMHKKKMAPQPPQLNNMAIARSIQNLLILSLYHMPKEPNANANLYKTYADLAYKKHAGKMHEGL